MKTDKPIPESVKLEYLAAIEQGRTVYFIQGSVVDRTLSQLRKDQMIDLVTIERDIDTSSCAGFSATFSLTEEGRLLLSILRL